MRIVTTLMVIASAWGCLPEAHAAALLEMTVKDRTIQGRLLAHNDRSCWLLDRDGQLNQIDLSKVRKHRAVESSFRSLSAAELRDELRREFGRSYKIVGTGHYLVVAEPSQADRYAKIFEDIYRTFHRYFSVRGFQIDRPEFPLVAVVFPDHKHFAKYAQTDGVRASRGLLGYYMPTTNRVALFDPGERQLSNRIFSIETRLAEKPLVAPFAAANRSNRLPAMNEWGRVGWHGKIQGGLQDTIVHETTHQVAFNAGLHSRIGNNPKWVVEGLATVFESPGIRDSSKGTTAKTRVNRERFVWFGNFSKSRRKDKSLASFIKSDKLFSQATLDGYSQAWALTFFLIETRSSQYPKYLKAVAERDPLQPYTSEQRLDDFQSAFGKDLDWLEVEFLRFIKRLNS